MVISWSVLKISDNLATALQSPDLSAAQGREMAKATVSVLTAERDDRAFDQLWDDAIKLQESLGVYCSPVPLQYDCLLLFLSYQCCKTAQVLLK